MKEPDHTSMHELGADARVARIFRWSAMAAAVLTVIVAVGLLAWWWLSRDTPVAVDEIAVLPPEPLARPGVEAPPALRCTDVTAQASIDFTHVNGAFGQRLLRETIGAGVAVFDSDNSGYQDILLVNSSYWPGHEDTQRPTLALYRNDGTGRFTDVTEEAGLDIDLYGMGVAVGDSTTTAGSTSSSPRSAATGCSATREDISGRSPTDLAEAYGRLGGLCHVHEILAGARPAYANAGRRRPVQPSTWTVAYPILSRADLPRLSRSSAVRHIRSPSGAANIQGVTAWQRQTSA